PSPGRWPSPLSAKKIDRRLMRYRDQQTCRQRLRVSRTACVVSAARPVLAEAFDACARAILILLGRATANPARTDEDATAEDRHSTLAEKPGAALGHDNATQRGMVGARR